MSGASENECPWYDFICMIYEAFGVEGDSGSDSEMGPPDDPEPPSEPPDDPDESNPYDDTSCMEWVWDGYGDPPLADPATGDWVPETGDGHWENVCYC